MADTQRVAGVRLHFKDLTEARRFTLGISDVRLQTEKIYYMASFNKFNCTLAVIRCVIVIRV